MERRERSRKLKKKHESKTFDKLSEEGDRNDFGPSLLLCAKLTVSLQTSKNVGWLFFRKKRIKQLAPRRFMFYFFGNLIQYWSNSFSAFKVIDSVLVHGYGHLISKHGFFTLKLF